MRQLVRIGSWLAVAGLLQALPATAAEALRYTVVLSGNVAGEMTVERKADDALRVAFSFNDRGRGPDVVEELRLDDRGLPVSIGIRGHDYLANPVAESFERDGSGRARWESSIERGEAPGAGAFYAAFHGTPYELVVLARALASADEKRLPLLPVGGATRIDGSPRTIASPGGPMEIRPVVIGGLGFDPVTLWLDAGGELFAFADAWLSVVRGGWEGSLPELIEAQRAATTERWREVAGEVSRRPAAPFVIRGARIFDSQTLATHEAWSVAVDGERIVAVGPDEEVPLPAGCQTIEAHGMTLLPGLWDMHTHLGATDGALHLAAGVTSVRDLANDVDELGALRRQWESGETLGPRVVAAGFLDGPGPYAGPTKALVETADEGRDWIRRYAALGYRQIKLYSSLRPELVAPLALEAHRLGLRVSGHVPAGMIAKQAIRDGYDEIQHINMVVLNFFPEIVETRTPARFTEVAARAAEIDPDGSAFRAFVELLLAHGTVIDPTVGIFQGMFRDRPGEISGEIAAVADRLPPTVRRGYLGGGLPVPDGLEATYRRSADRLLEMVAALHRAGVPIVAGTDAMAGFALHRELELYVLAGIPAPEVLSLATLGAARVMGLDGELGRVAPGKLADFILVEGNPERNIGDVRRVRTVVRGGRIIDAAALYAALGVAPAP